MRDWLSPSTLQMAQSLLTTFAPVLWQVFLTAVRVYGLTLTAPVLSSSVVPQRLRLAIAVMLGAVVGTVAPVSADLAERDWLDRLWLSGGELALGAALGLGVSLVLAGLQIAATLIEQQWGHPGPTVDALRDDGAARTTAGELLGVLGVLVFLCVTPVGGDLAILRSLLDSFRTLPVGAIESVAGPVQFVHDVVLAALLLGLQVAAPVVVSTGIVQGACALLARGRGGASWSGAIAPIRLLFGLLVLTVTLTGVGERIGAAMQGVMTAGPVEMAPAATTEGPAP